jgi:hypothetical protein
MSLSRTKRLHVIIHGGMHKTGTTSFQYTLAANRQALLREGICYPSISEAHHRILNVRRADWQPVSCSSALDEARQMGAGTLILSSEVVSVLSFQQLQRLSACFSEHDLTYLFCFRHWTNFFASRWAQNCTRRDSQTFSSYVNMITHSMHEHPDYRYDLIMDRAVSLGNCNVMAISYDNAITADGSTVPAILRAAGLPKQLINLLVSKRVDLNARPDPKVVELCRLFNGIIADREKLPQDDLCRSIGEHRQCCGSFDLVSEVAALEPSLRNKLFAILEKYPLKVIVPPDFGSVRHCLSLAHGHRFINRLEERIFPDKEFSQLSYRDLEWQQFRELAAEARLCGALPR